MRLTPPRSCRDGWRCLALALTLAVLVQPTQGTSVRHLGLPEMVERAGQVALVRALENRVRTDDATLHHYTVTRFQVLESAKGSRRPGDTFELEVIGGHAPGSIYETTVAGAPRFAVGEELVLFTRPGRTGGEHILGFFQGAVRLRRDADGNRVLVAPPPNLRPEPAVLEERTPAGLRRSPGPAGGAPAPAGESPAARPSRPPAPAAAGAPGGAAVASEPRPLRVDEFLNRVRAMAAAAASRPR